MNFIRYHVVQVTMVILYMTVLWPLIMLADYLGKQAGLHLAWLAVRTVTGVWLVVSLWMSYQTSKRVVFGNMTLGKATVASVDGALPYLAFLPLVGRFFVSHKKDRNRGGEQDI